MAAKLQGSDLAAGALDGILTKINAILTELAITGVTVTAGANTPEGAVTAAVGSVFLRTNGGANTTLYIKESGAGNTGWVAK